MDVRPGPRGAADRPPAPPCPAGDDLPGILTSLRRELARPLAALRDEVGEALSGPVQPAQADQLRAMAGLCDELLDLTRDYLDYACLARGARPPQFATVALSALAAEVDRRFRPEADRREIAWRCALEGPEAHVATDPDICREVAGHLVANALKSTPVGGAVSATFRREGAWWTLTVADTGLGIPEEDRGRVFEPFYRLPRDERAGSEGCGLGLATCREQVAQLGGTITIGPDSGSGTTLVVRLPVDSGTAPS